MTITPPEPEKCNGNGDAKARRHSSVLAALGLVFITASAVAGLVYDAVINNGSSSVTQLSTIATLGLGGLLAISGQKGKDDK